MEVMSKNKSILTLTTDLGYKDHYAGVLKGQILSKIPGVSVIDITHDIQSFNIIRAAFVVKNAAFYFPENTVHLVGVSPEISTRSSEEGQSAYPMMMKFKGHYFIAADNGFFSLLTEGEEFDHLVRLDTDNDSNTVVDPINDVMLSAVEELFSGKDISELGESTTHFRQAVQFAPTISENLIKGSVIHIDKYGNIITNIQRIDFDRVGKGNQFIIYFRRKEYYIDRLSNTYGDVSPGEKLAFFNSGGHLEISINKGTNDTRGGADALFGVHLQDLIRVEFFPKGSKENFESLF